MRPHNTPMGTYQDEVCQSSPPLLRQSISLARDVIMEGMREFSYAHDVDMNAIFSNIGDKFDERPTSIDDDKNVFYETFMEFTDFSIKKSNDFNEYWTKVALFDEFLEKQYPTLCARLPKGKFERWLGQDMHSVAVENSIAYCFARLKELQSALRSQQSEQTAHHVQTVKFHGEPTLIFCDDLIDLLPKLPYLALMSVIVGMTNGKNQITDDDYATQQGYNILKNSLAYLFCLNSSYRDNLYLFTMYGDNGIEQAKQHEQKRKAWLEKLAQQDSVF